MPHCCVCEQTVAAWTPHPAIERRSPFMATMQAVGSDLSVYLCPACGCIDRERHLWLYLHATGVAQGLSGSRVLHMAPERHLEQLIERCGPARYVRGDLHPTRANQQKLDVEALPFDDASFDVILCNHILEHVSDPDRALRELRRCLREGGVLIAQTPYSPLLKQTFELTQKPGVEFATLYFGQDDHVRLFGADLEQRFRDAGFEGRLLSHAELLPQHDARDWGCNGREPFFAFVNPAAALKRAA